MNDKPSICKHCGDERVRRKNGSTACRTCDRNRRREFVKRWREQEGDIDISHINHAMTLEETAQAMWDLHGIKISREGVRLAEISAIAKLRRLYKSVSDEHLFDERPSVSTSWMCGPPESE